MVPGGQEVGLSGPRPRGSKDGPTGSHKVKREV